MKEKIIIKLLGKQKALSWFGIRPKPTKTAQVNLAMNGQIIKFMVSQLNNQ